ncbi:bacteriocin [Tenacibaculum sp. TC6]|uniref:bacteriocin n=1 Tax=Tenacibaculum sp. TC6 TaxID=3423223 RepID=UPI003D36EAD3
MKLSNFQFEQLSASELQNVTGGTEQLVEEGSSHTLRHSTSCTGTDHDAGRHDSD